MPLEINLLLQNVHAAFVNQQYPHAQFLLEYAMTLSTDDPCAPIRSFPDVSIGLHHGHIRPINEDCILALNGTLPTAQNFGLYIVCDGMGGHVHGQEAAHLALLTMLECALSFLFTQDHLHTPWEQLLAESIRKANRAIHTRNQLTAEKGVLVPHPQRAHMGTTVTAALLVGETAYIANVGDSRTYLYTHGLSQITKDHSLVAQGLADGILTKDDLYTHPQRNQITRALGTDASVEVDTFVCPLPPDAILLLCSDGLWEMTRDHKIEEVLASPWAHASSMTRQLVQLAKDGGGTDNIGCVVIQLQPRTDSSSMATTILEPLGAVTRLMAVSPSSL